jgi:hypothetical protein
MRSVELEPINTLTVEVRSAPGSSVLITVFGETQTVAEALTDLEAAGQIPVLDRSTSITGPDGDGNGVRDDLDNYIDSLPDTVPQKAALRQASKAIDAAMQAGDSGSSTPSELKEVSTAIARAVHCIWDRYDAETAPTKVATIQKLMVNTRARVDAYDLYNTKRSGSSSRLPRGEACETP